MDNLRSSVHSGKLILISWLDSIFCTKWSVSLSDGVRRALNGFALSVIQRTFKLVVANVTSGAVSCSLCRRTVIIGFMPPPSQRCRRGITIGVRQFLKIHS